MQERSSDNWRTDLSLRKTRTIVLDSGDAEEKRQEILDYFHKSFDIDEALLEMLRYDKTFYMRADPLRHPLIFYFGHTATFYVNKLIMAKVIDKRINPKFESMFAVGVDEMSWDDLDEANYDWPEIEAVQGYRNQVRKMVDKLIKTMPLTMPIDWENPWWSIIMGIEHSRIHLETSSVLIRQLPLEHVRAHPLWQICGEAGEAPVNELIDVPSGAITLGKDFTAPLYGWDNEYGSHAAEVDSFKASRYLVSNGEYREFIEAGGYGHQKCWTEEGWSWKEYEQAEMPRFWRKDESGYKLRCVAEEIDMPWNWPVEVNQLEAKAFCNWKSEATGKKLRLPSEDEWYYLRDRQMNTDQPYWETAPGNINLEYYASSCPVDKYAFGEYYDIVGNVWQWTETPISGYRGFKVHPIYDDFSVPTFDSRHNLMKGGSWISTGNEAIRDGRYAFRRHFYQHAGLRYIESEKDVVVKGDVYESDPIITQYCEFHFGDEYYGVANYPKRIAEFCLEQMAGKSKGKALDLGCAVGRASFELAREFESVTGLDFSARIIKPGVELKEEGYLRYTRQEEGELESYQEVRLSELGLEEAAKRVELYQADACNLKALFSGYDLVLASNLIDRLAYPKRFLEMIHKRINRGGLLVVASPYSWDEAFTEKENWLGGYRKDGEPYTTLEALGDVLGGHFEMVGKPVELEMVIRETKRKYQHTRTEVSTWQRT